MNRVRCISVHFHLQRRKEHTCREITIKIYVTSTHQVKTCMVISMKTLPRVFSRKRVHRAWSEEQANTKELHLVCFQTFLLRLRECSFSIELIHHHRELKTTSRPKGGHNSLLPPTLPCIPQSSFHNNSVDNLHKGWQRFWHEIWSHWLSLKRIEKIHRYE